MGMNHTPTLARYQTERENQLNHLLRLLALEPRVHEGWLFGSLARGDADALSDIDLILTVPDEHLAPLIDDRYHFAGQAGPPLFTLDAPQNAPPGGGYLMICLDAPTAPHLLDLYWQSDRLAWDASQARRVYQRADDTAPGRSSRPAPGHRGAGDALPHPVRYFWMMLLITAKHAARHPQAPDLHLLPYLYPAYLESLQTLASGALREALPQPAAFAGPADKLALLRGMAGQVNDCAERALPGASAAIFSAVRRYLTMMEAALAAKNHPESNPEEMP